MKAVILVPYRPDGGPRSRNWHIAAKRWEQMGIRLYANDSGHDEFQRAHSRNAVAREAGDWDVALFADADIVLDSIDQADAALMRCYRTGAYTVAYSDLWYLTEKGTEDLVGGDDPVDCETDEHVGFTWECCFAVRRDIFARVGGFDERFVGWGGQVAAFFYAYATFGGRERIAGEAYHLAHPLVDRNEDPNFPANCALADRYLAAVDDPVAMAALLEERP